MREPKRKRRKKRAPLPKGEIEALRKTDKESQTDLRSVCKWIAGQEKLGFDRTCKSLKIPYHMSNNRVKWNNLSKKDKSTRVLIHLLSYGLLRAWEPIWFRTILVFTWHHGVLRTPERYIRPLVDLVKQQM